VFRIRRAPTNNAAPHLHKCYVDRISSINEPNTGAPDKASTNAVLAPELGSTNAVHARWK
jgi:hypothetical protein